MKELIEIKLDSLKAQPYLPLKKRENGSYPLPAVRCGILPYYIDSKSQIVWGGVKTNRIGPLTISLPAGTQDIFIVDTQSQQQFTLEVGKPFPSLGYPFLQEHVDKLFRGADYQAILACLEENKFDIYIEDFLATAIHETQEEHGFDLREDSEHRRLVKNVYQLPSLSLSGEQGATAQQFWLASLQNRDGIVLNDVEKVEKKIRRNLGRKFYEKGCWSTLEEFNKVLTEAKTYPCSPGDGVTQPELISGIIKGYEETIYLLGRIESVIRADFRKSAFPRGLYPFFLRSSYAGEEIIRETESIISVSEHIRNDTWVIFDLDNTVIEPVTELGGDEWFVLLSKFATTVEKDKGMAFALLIYAAVQRHIHVKAVEPGVVALINKLQDHGTPVLALTARNINVKQDTIDQLKSIGIDFSRNLPREMVINTEGIIFCNAKDKGEVWERFLLRCSCIPEHVVMIDDKKRHLDRMSKVTKELHIHFTGLRYSLLDKKEATFNMTEANQQLAFLMQYLPTSVQEVIRKLRIIDNLDSQVSAPSCPYNFFSREGRNQLLVKSDVDAELSKISSKAFAGA
jgi:hypothetical protein